MKGQNQKIEGLKKVSLSLEAGTTGKKMDLSSDPVLFEMVVGVGTEGYTPFEYELLGKETGDTIQIEITGGNLRKIFAHFDVPLPEKARALSSFFLKATVEGVAAANQTEVVRAMARTISECGGDCCGNH